MNRDALLKLLVRLGGKAGVQDSHPHRFRHTFAVNFLRNGGNAFELQMALGHTTLDMGQTYLSLAQTDPSASSGQAWTRRIGRRRRWRIGGYEDHLKEQAVKRAHRTNRRNGRVPGRCYTKATSGFPVRRCHAHHIPLRAGIHRPSYCRQTRPYDIATWMVGAGFPGLMARPSSPPHVCLPAIPRQRRKTRPHPHAPPRRGRVSRAPMRRPPTSRCVRAIAACRHAGQPDLTITHACSARGRKARTDTTGAVSTSTACAPRTWNGSWWRTT